jgi:hypothetical protein
MNVRERHDMILQEVVLSHVIPLSVPMSHDGKTCFHHPVFDVQLPVSIQRDAWMQGLTI